MIFKSVLITGGAGFIGSHLCDHYLSLGLRVIVIDNLSNGEKKYLPQGIEFFKTDIQNSESIERIISKTKPDLVSHHAAQTKVISSTNNPINDAKDNIIGTINILHQIKNSSVKKIIFSSSGGAIYGNNKSAISEKKTPFPVSFYGLSKLTAEKYIEMFCKNEKISYSILRYSNVYGPRQKFGLNGGVISTLIYNSLSNRSSTIYGDGESERDYVYISDIVSVNKIALNNKFIGTYNIGTGVSTSVNKLLDVVQKKTGNFKKPQKKDYRKDEVKKNFLDISKITLKTGWSPKINLGKGIEETIEWQKKYLFSHPT